MEGIDVKEDVLTGKCDKFKQAFKHFFNGVVSYFKGRGFTKVSVSFGDITDYITGYLSIDGHIDLEWKENEQDFGDFGDEVIKQVYTYCAVMHSRGENRISIKNTEKIGIIDYEAVMKYTNLINNPENSNRMEDMMSEYYLRIKN